jgi:hypothetical protein
MACESVLYEFKTNAITYFYKDLENILRLDIFIWFPMDYGFLGIYESKSVDAELIVRKDGSIDINFKDGDKACCYKGMCKNISELLEFLEEISNYWGFGGLF